MAASWTNWAGNVACRPLQVHRPADEAEIVALVRWAGERGERVKVVGSGHSSSDIAASDGAHLVSLSRCRRVLALDRRARRVTVEAGITLAELNAALAAAGLALPSLGVISAQSVGGLISTGTHGTGLGHGCIAEQVVGLRLVTASGEVREITEERSPDLLRAARVSLGALGVVSAVTFACCEAFNLELETRPAVLDDALAELEDLSGEADHVGLWWFPHVDRVSLRIARRTDREASPTPSLLSRWWVDHVLGNHLHAAGLWCASFSPGLVPTVNAGMFRLLFASEERRVGRSDLIFSCTILVRQQITEYAVAVERAGEAILGLRDLLARERMTAHAPIDVRFTGADESWLSPSFGRRSCWIGVIVYRPFGRFIPFESLFRRVDAFMAGLGGRPHWGKVHYRAAADLGSLYPRWSDFRDLRRDLDPSGMFLNDHLRRILG